jgi:hypothetical protein
MERMNVNEIITKRTATDAEMAFVVEQYIRIRTGRQISVPSAMDWSEQMMLIEMYFNACEWLALNRDQR